MATSVAVELADSFHRLTQVIERGSKECSFQEHLLGPEEALGAGQLDTHN